MVKRGGNRGPRSKRAPDKNVEDEDDNDNVQGSENNSEQTDDEKRRVRRQLRELCETLQKKREKLVSGDHSEDLTHIISEANDLLKDVKGTHEAMEDAKMFKMLCQLVREISEDTNTNEKKFHYDEFAALIGRSMNAQIDSGNMVKITRRQLVSFGERINKKFRRSPSFGFILGTLDTDAGEDKPARQRERKVDKGRQMAPTKTAIVEKSQADGQMTDKLVTSTRKILEQQYKQGGKKPVNYFKFVIDPHSFGNTVENMFHVSFLVKQRVVQLSVDDNIGLPVLEPVSSRHQADGDGDIVKNQAIISLSFEDWEDLKEALEVTSPAIVHDEQLRRAISSK